MRLQFLSLPSIVASSFFLFGGGANAQTQSKLWVNEINLDGANGQVEFACKSGAQLGWTAIWIYRGLGAQITQFTIYGASRNNAAFTCPDGPGGYSTMVSHVGHLNFIHDGPVSTCTFNLLTGEVFDFVGFGIQGTPTTGPCAGMTTTPGPDVFSPNLGASKIGTGCYGDDFTWRNDRALQNIWTIPNNGQTFDCTPPPVGGADGDPHIHTWDGEWYDYMGKCDMVLLDAPSFGKGLGLTAHIRTELRYDYSYISEAAIQIGEEVFEVGSFGESFLNGVSDAKMPATIAGFPITFEEKTVDAHFFTVDLKDHGSITLKAYKDLVGIKFEGTLAEDYGDSVGLMGSFDKGLHLARDGKTILEDSNAFGQEWQVISTEPQLFQTQAPVTGKCVLPSPKTKTGRRLVGDTISHEEAERACAKHPQSLEQCIYDVIATNDLSAADAGIF